MRRATKFGAILCLAFCTHASPQKGQPKDAFRPGPAPRPRAGGVPKPPRSSEETKKGPPRIGLPDGNVERLLAMPPEQRDRVLEKLPPARQNALRQRFEQFDKRPPEERARLLEAWKQIERLEPEKRELLTRQLRTFNALPDERRKVIGPALNQLRRLTPEKREERLNDEAFRSRFTPDELQMMSGIAENYPLRAK